MSSSCGAGPAGGTQITGLSQGLFEVERGPHGQVRVTRQPNPNLVLQPGSSMSAENLGIAMPLDQLVAQIRGMLGSRRASVR